MACMMESLETVVIYPWSPFDPATGHSPDACSCVWPTYAFAPEKCACRIFLIIMSSGFSLSATIDKYFNLLLRITGTSDNGRKFLELASDQEGESVRRLLPQGFGYIGTENSLRRRVTATAAALSDDQDEIQPVQHHRLEVSAAAPHRTTSITVMHDVQASFCAGIHIHTLSCIHTNIIFVMYARVCESLLMICVHRFYYDAIGVGSASLFLIPNSLTHSQGGSGALSLSGEIGILSPPSAPSASQTAFVTCHLCGAQVKPGYSFCNTCGQRIEVREDDGMEAEGNVRGTMV